MYVVWALLGALLAWPLLGALIGLAAAFWKGFPVAEGVIPGFVLGPLTLVMFFGSAEDRSVHSNRHRLIVYEQGLSSRFAARRCPKCTGPNASLIWQGMTALWKDNPGDFVPSHREVFTHRYRCIRCGYEWEFESPLMDPDKPPVRVY